MSSSICKAFATRRRLDRFEARRGRSTSIARLATRKPIKGPFDAARLKESHRRIFGKVYPWAGEFRQGIGMMGKNRSGFVVAYGPSQNVPTALGEAFAKLKAEGNLQGLDAGRFASRLAFYYSELDAIHAFREGNSRTLRRALHLTWRRRPATGWSGHEWGKRRKTGSGSTMRAIWRLCAETLRNLSRSFLARSALTSSKSPVAAWRALAFNTCSSGARTICSFKNRDFRMKLHAKGLFALNSATISAAAFRASSPRSGEKLMAPTRACPPPP